MKLLEQTIKELKGEELEDEVRANVNLRVDLRIDETYIPEMNQRLTVYRRMAAVRKDDELRKLVEEVRDRYGAPPETVLNLAEYASIRLMADKLRLESIDREAQTVVLKFRQDARLDPKWLFNLVNQRGELTLVPPATLKLNLAGPTVRSAPVAPAPSVRQDGRITRSSLSKRGNDPVAGGSWWAARAQTGEVTGGFSKDEILKPKKEDPRGEAGIFSRVSSLLEDLGRGA